MGRPSVWIISEQPDLIRALRPAVSMAGMELFRGDADPTEGTMPDLVLLDAVDPATHVPSALSRVADRAHGRFVPVIAVTPDDVSVKVRALRDGVHECIPYPFHMEELVARMAGLLRLKTLQDQVWVHEQALTRANRELVRLSTLKDEFIATLSHELRTPLTAICEFTSLVLDEVPGRINAGQRECLEVTHSNCQHLSMMIDDMLNLSRIVSGTETLEKAPTNLVSLVDEVLGALAHMAASRKVRMVASGESDVVVAPVDRTRMRRVLMNLVSNAIKFTPPETEVRVVAETDAARSLARMIVIDQGPGLSPEQHQQVFERFFQSERGWTSKSGLGLGLSVCLEIVSMHQGRIRVESAEGDGCRFYVELPLDEASAAIGPVAVLGPDGPSSGAPEGNV